MFVLLTIVPTIEPKETLDKEMNGAVKRLYVNTTMLAPMVRMVVDWSALYCRTASRSGCCAANEGAKLSFLRK